MAQSNIKIEKLHPDDLDEYIDLYCTAFQDPAAGIFMAIIYPMGLHHPLVHARLRAGYDFSEPSTTYRVAKDTQTGQIIGVAKWTFSEDSADSPRGDFQTELGKARQKTFEENPIVPGMNVALLEKGVEVVLAARHDVERPFMDLELLAVHPEHQRRGVGALLIREMLEDVDEKKLPAYVIAGKQGVTLYERHGFKAIGTIPLDGRDYGSENACTHLNMFRAARP